MASARLRVGQFFANLHEATSVKGRYRLTHLCAHSLLIFVQSDHWSGQIDWLLARVCACVCAPFPLDHRFQTQFHHHQSLKKIKSLLCEVVSTPSVPGGPGG